MLQSEEAGELYLNYAREAVMTRGLNIARTEVILLLAKTIANDAPEIFDYAQFEKNWNKGSGCESFVEDLKETRLHSIQRFPTLILSSQGKQSISVTGYRPYSVMLETFVKLAPAM
jgi:predicted DsbA family dithiol-disulfide isomerase